MRATAAERAQDRIGELAGRGLDLVTLARGGGADRARCPALHGRVLVHAGPGLTLITSHFNEHMPQLPPEALAHEYYEDDVNKLVDVVRSAAGVSTLHDATGDDPASSPRWHANMALGGDQELIAALRTTRGGAWGGMGLYREPGRHRRAPRRLGAHRPAAPQVDLRQDRRPQPPRPRRQGVLHPL